MYGLAKEQIMQKIEVDNKLDLAVFINDTPDLSLIPDEVAERIVAALEMQISEHYKNQEDDKNS